MNEAPPSQGLVGGKYQLIKKIGKGGMGSVWEARHVSLGTSSAIKFIEAEYANSAEARSRFDKEAKAAATIQSKHAIQIFDHGVTDDGKPYIVMELLLGEPLDKCIERQQLSLPETVRILQQVCRGLARAHERGIIHRDLKPENIYLVRTPDDDETIAKVLDFGIAKISSTGPGSSGGITNGTKTGAVLGTPFYMSPEQARGLRNVDHRTDVWSLGVIAFKCITGRLPFDGESIGDLLVKICTSPIPVPSHVMPGLPPAFDAWFARALDREPDRRFASVTELSEALGQVAGLAPRGPSHFSGTPVSGSVQPGMTTPVTGPYSPHHTPPYQTPGTPQPYMATPQYGPSPVGMTAAPFTAESIPGVASSGRTRLIMTVMIASLALGIGIAAFAMSKLPRGGSTTANASAPSIGSTTVASATPPTTAAPPASTVPPLPVAQPLPVTQAPVVAAEKKKPAPAAQPGPPPPAIVIPQIALPQPPPAQPQPQPAPHPAPNGTIPPPDGYGNPTPNTSLPTTPSNNKNRAAGY